MSPENGGVRQSAQGPIRHGTNPAGLGGSDRTNDTSLSTPDEIRQATVASRHELNAVKNLGDDAGLRKLTVEGDFTDDDLRGLPHSLQELDLSKARGITDLGLVHLSRLPLASLTIGDGNETGDVGAGVLAGHPTLTSLYVGNSVMSDAGKRALAVNTELTAHIEQTDEQAFYEATRSPSGGQYLVGWGMPGEN
ncbi:hypothetical protein LJR230_001718 [Trinickia sp. LjRoot230]|uniref:hypothetical protein n=1 Tax=Trinickia sp. LjRoot230 TaxID=3342288 RepID=UPI003ECDC95C